LHSVAISSRWQHWLPNSHGFHSILRNWTTSAYVPGPTNSIVSSKVVFSQHGAVLWLGQKFYFPMRAGYVKLIILIRRNSLTPLISWQRLENRELGNLVIIEHEHRDISFTSIKPQASKFVWTELHDAQELLIKLFTILGPTPNSVFVLQSHTQFKKVIEFYPSPI